MVSKFIYSCYAAALLLLAATGRLYAGSHGVSEAHLHQQRQWFQRAEQIAHKPQSSEFKYLRQKLKDYPLYPYVELKTLMHYPYLANKGRIEAFLQGYEKSPLDKPLRSKWLKYLADKNQQALYLHFYRDIGNAALTCKQLDFMLQRQDRVEQALQQVEQLWLVGKSQPKSCDPAFKRWQQSGGRSDKLVWQRLVLAADGGKHTLIPYLKTLLPKEQQYLADLWLKVRRAPSYVSRLSQFPGKYPAKEAEIIAYGLGRLVWRDKKLALKSWQAVKQRYQFNHAQQQRIASKFAIGLVTSNHDQAEFWLQRAGRLVEDKELSRWHLAHVLRRQDWQHALQLIQQLPAQFADSYEFKYWQARGYQQLDAPEAAKQSFARLAKHRHYYGFLASGQLNTKPNLADSPLRFTQQQLDEVANMPAAQRAYELYQIKRYASARREWRYLRSTLTAKQKQIAAVIADSWGWHDQAIFTFSSAGYMDDVKRRFPVAFSKQLIGQAKKQNIDPEWAFAIVRRESSFMPDANSGAGAKGLMQLMPGTARYLAKKKVSNKSLFDPARNVEFGTQYMRYLMNKMDNNPVLVTAAYNAGWRRVNHWLPMQGSMPMDIWVETIPYKETREYVKAVMAYRQIYAQLLGKQSSMFTELANMQIFAKQHSF